MRQFVKKDRGNALIMGALSFAVLASFGVLTIDIGRIFVTKNQLQNAADAGALAGASMYCEEAAPSEEAVKDRVRLVGQAHKALSMDVPQNVDIPDGQIVITNDVDNARMIVEVTTQTPTRQYFLNLLQFASNPGEGGAGGTSANVHAVAAAACGATCGVSCVKPWAIPDRWDDFTPIQGYNGGKLGNWAGDKAWSHEKLTTDVNGNQIYDPGDGYEDLNGNGQYDAEAYNSLLTGYIPDPYPGNTLSPNGDLGLELTLKANNGSNPAPGMYQAVDLPPINRGTPTEPDPVTGADEYRENIASCNQASVWPGDWLQAETGNMVGPTNQGMRDLIAQDPDAYWDPITQSVQGSLFPISPRIVLIPVIDPRIPYDSGKKNYIQVVKVAAFFMEQMEGNAEVRGKFLKVRQPGEPCVAGAGGGGATSFTYSLSLIR